MRESLKRTEKALLQLLLNWWSLSFMLSTYNSDGGCVSLVRALRLSEHYGWGPSSVIVAVFFLKKKNGNYSFVPKDMSLVSFVLTLVYNLTSERDGKCIFAPALLLV